MSSALIARHCLVSGRVQGVYFRASAREQARVLGVRGHARNLAEGSVEVLAVGPVEAVEQLIVWLRKGPPSARVDAVAVTDVTPAPDLESFAVL